MSWLGYKMKHRSLQSKIFEDKVQQKQKRTTKKPLHYARMQSVQTAKEELLRTGASE